MNIREQLAAEHDMSMEYVNWFFDHKKEGCGNVWFIMVAAMWEGWQAASKASEQQLAAVVAENAGLKSKGREVLNEACKVYEKLNATISSDSGDFIDGQTLHEFQFLLDVETPATDAYLAEARAQVWIEAKELAKSAVASDSIDHIDFLFDGKAAQLRQGATS